MANQEMVDFLVKQLETFGPEALREHLVKEGSDPAVVDESLKEAQRVRSGSGEGAPPNGKKSLLAAGLFSLFAPGAGQAYNGRKEKAWAYGALGLLLPIVIFPLLLGFAVIVKWAALAMPMIVFAVYLFALADAVSDAHKINKGTLPASGGNWKIGLAVLAAVLVLKIGLKTGGVPRMIMSAVGGQKNLSEALSAKGGGSGDLSRLSDEELEAEIAKVRSQMEDMRRDFSSDSKKVGDIISDGISATGTAPPSGLAALAAEGKTKAQLGSLRAGLSLHYGDTEGEYPKHPKELIPKNAKSISPVSTGRHPASAQVLVYDGSICSGAGKYGNGLFKDRLRDTGAWGYVYGPDAPCHGHLFVDCTHTDSKGHPWYSF